MRSVLTTTLGVWIAIAAPSAQSNMRSRRNTPPSRSLPALRRGSEDLSRGYHDQPVVTTPSAISTVVSAKKDRTVCSKLCRSFRSSATSTRRAREVRPAFARQRPEPEAAKMIFLMTTATSAPGRRSTGRDDRYPFTLIHCRSTRMAAAWEGLDLQRRSRRRRTARSSSRTSRTSGQPEPGPEGR